MPPKDPRRIITPDAFTVAPELLGIGLARPSRRLFAIAVDGILIAILSHVGGKILLALGAAIILWRGAQRDKRKAEATGRRTSIVSLALRFASVLAFFLFILGAYSWMKGRVLHPKSGKAAATAEADSVADTDYNGYDGDNNFEFNSDSVDFKKLGLKMSDLPMMPTALAIGKASDSATAAPKADSLAQWIATKPDTMRKRLAIAFMTMFGQTGGAPALRVALKPYLPADTVIAGANPLVRENEHLKNQVKALKNRTEKLQNDLSTEKKGFTIKKMLNSLSDLLGFGFGWSALYFTTLTLWMKGQTPGKKLFGIRVIRLDNRPLTGWLSFERFGGYAASAAIGLLGFAQILWDRNRQALHDKATETVVIRERNGVPDRPFDTDPRPNPFRAASAK